jgi:hypothetical protein
MTSYRRNVVIASAFLIALLLAAIIPNFRRGVASLAHPDPVGPTAYSRSAIGHIVFYNLLGEVGIFTEISESGSGGHVGSSDVLVIAEPRTDDATLSEVRAMLTARNVLVVLPKRTGEPDQKRPYWLTSDLLLPEKAVAAVLHLVDADATLVRGASLASLSSGRGVSGTPAITKPQLVRSKQIHPLVASADGILIGERRLGNRRIVVLSDPDIISNHGLARGENSILAVHLIESLRRDASGTVIFDEFIHGFSPKPFHLLGILFQFPFLLVTLQMGLAVALLIWAATARFGAPTILEPPMEAGKRSLIDTGARLLTRAGRIPDLSDRYFEEMVRDTGRRLRAPRGLELTALITWLNQAAGRTSPPPTAPQQIWAWRKELLGEPRPRTNPD